MITKILVPVDFSDCSKVALQYALSLSEQFAAPIHLLHVWDIPGHLRPDLTVWAGDISASLAEHARVEAQQALEEFTSSMGIQGRDNVSSASVTGAPAPTIVSVAKEEGYDLIVMGTHGRTGFSHLVLGSIAENVVRRAHCPVLTVRTKE